MLGLAVPLTVSTEPRLPLSVLAQPALVGMSKQYGCSQYVTLRNLRPFPPQIWHGYKAEILLYPRAPL